MNFLAEDVEFLMLVAQNFHKLVQEGIKTFPKLVFWMINSIVLLKICK